MCVKDATPAPPARRRILIVDDHALVRRGLSVLIDNEPDLTVCAVAATQREGFEAIAFSRPDLVIADLSLGDGDGRKRRLSTVLRRGGIVQRRRDGVCLGRGTFTSSVNVSSS